MEAIKDVLKFFEIIKSGIVVEKFGKIPFQKAYEVYLPLIKLYVEAYREMWEDEDSYSAELS